MKLISIAALVAGLAVAGGASAATNLITNGDFSAGDTGFTHGPEYTFVPLPPGPNSEQPAGTETITVNPIDVHSSWVDLGPSANNPMLVVNGATNSGATLWEEDGITTSASGVYDFSANVMDICCNATFGNQGNAPSDIIFQVSVNGGSFVDVASYMTTPGMPAQSGDSGILKFITGSFNSTAGGNFDIRAINNASAPGGNDFAIDNIVVSAAPEPTTWGLMIIGVGMVGGALRAARKSRRLSLVRAA
jgi:hypothetical protein